MYCGFKIMISLLVVDIWTIGSILGNWVENPNFGKIVILWNWVGNDEIGSLYGRIVELDLSIAHFWKYWYFICWIFYYLFRNNCLGYRWRVVLIVVDNAWWLGNLKLINWICHRVWRLIEYINIKYWLIVNMTLVYIRCVCGRKYGMYSTA